jgi:hypothetical protein
VSIELQATEDGIPVSYTTSPSFTMLSDGTIVKDGKATKVVNIGQFLGTEANIGSCSAPGTFGGVISSTVNGTTSNYVILPSASPPVIQNLAYSSNARVVYNVSFSSCNGITDSISITINNAYIS